LEGVYVFPEDMLRDSQRLHARQRLMGFDLIRSNPKICGFNLTGMLDHSITGEGLWSLWRRWKPGIVDALEDGWAPLRWCLFVEPLHGYINRKLTIEAVLANEDILKPDVYPICLRISGPQGIVWEKKTSVNIKPLDFTQDGPLAIPVLCEDIQLTGPSGVYEFAAVLEQGGAPSGGRLKFYLSNEDDLPRLETEVTLFGIDKSVEKWLKTQGVKCKHYSQSAQKSREVILIGDISKISENAKILDKTWKELLQRITAGAAVIFLSPLAFKHEEDPVKWLPLKHKGRLYSFQDWLYHNECIAKAHPIFDRLQANGIMDWDYYGQVIPHYIFENNSTPYDTAAAAFAVGYNCIGGYDSGVLVGTYKFGSGIFTLNTLRILENINIHPAANRLLLNMIKHASKFIDQPLTKIPEKI
jgi:hypothetical protein